MTQYANLQSSSLYPTSGDFCDWHYGVHRSYYTSEIGTAFHQRPEDIGHIAVRNLGLGTSPKSPTTHGSEPTLRSPTFLNKLPKNEQQTVIPDEGDIPIDFIACPISSLTALADHRQWRRVKPSRLQSDYGPANGRRRRGEYGVSMVEAWMSTGGGNGTCSEPCSRYRNGSPARSTTRQRCPRWAVRSVPVHGKPYYELEVTYRAAFGSVPGAFFTFTVVATFVWGGLAVALRIMLSTTTTPYQQRISVKRRAPSTI